MLNLSRDTVTRVFQSLQGNEVVQRDGSTRLLVPKLPLLKGQYSLTAFLMCERAVHVYEAVEHFATVQVSLPHLEQGLFSIPHQWQTI
jgi:lipopolysaccharide transport system ATP-binding protein